MSQAPKDDNSSQPELLPLAKAEWESAFDAVSDLVMVLDGRYQIVRANRALSDRLGLPYSKIIGQPCHRLLHGLNAPPDYCPHHLLLHDGREHSSEIYEAGLGGHFLVTCLPLRDGQGRLAGAVHIARDINDGKSAELTTRQQNLCLKALHDTALDLMNRRDLSGLLTTMLEQAAGLMDSSLGWIALLEGSHMVFTLGAGLLKSQPRILVAPGQGFTGRVWRAAAPLALDNYQEVPDRLTSPAWAEVKAVAGVPIVCQGQVQGVLAVARTSRQPAFKPAEIEMLARFGALASLAMDNARLHEDARRELAERRQAEEALEWELMVNSAQARLAHYLISPDLDLPTVANAVLELAQGMTSARDGFVGNLEPATHGMVCRTHALIMDESRPMALGQPDPVFASDPGGQYPGLWGYALNTGSAFFTNDPASHPGSLETSPGRIAPRNFLAVPVVMEGELLGLIALANSCQGFTSRDQQAVGRLAELYALALHRQRAQDDRERLSDQLRHNQKMEALVSLAGGVAHDFNNILGTILGFTEIALDENRQGGSAEEDLENVLASCQRAKDLVGRLLSFSRPGREERQAIDLAPLLEEACQLLRVNLPTNIAIECDAQAGGPLALAAPNQIHQVIMNLCANAAQALDGGGRITLGLSAVGPAHGALAQLHGLPAGNYLRLLVADDGPGMDPSLQEHIFEPFFSTKREKGSGLGLAVVHGIIQAHQGGLQVSSAPGQGSSFSLLLPQAQPAGQLGATAGQGEAPPPTGLTLRGNERIMVVDDEPALLEVVRRMLGTLGYRVEVYSDSQTALFALRSRPWDFDLLLTDQTMPGLTGDRLAAEALRLRPELPVLVCTGFSQSLSQERARSLGIRQLLMKPLSRQQLAQALRQALEHPAGTAASYINPF